MSVSPVELIIVGAGGHGSELASYLKDFPRSAQVRLAGFVDEGKPKGSFAGGKILGNLQDLKVFLRRNGRRRFRYITAVGHNRTRQKLADAVEALGAGNLSAWTLRHPSSMVGQQVEIGEGTCLAPGTLVTTRGSIGKHCILNVQASVSHDAVIGDYCNINPGPVICGNVRLGRGCYLGAGATVIDKISIGEWTIIGAGAVVVEDLPARVTAVGVPARIIKRPG